MYGKNNLYLYMNTHISEVLQTINSLDDFVNSINDKKTKFHILELFKIFKFANSNDLLLALQGGFAVDFAAGHLTRPHDDIDLIIEQKAVALFKNYLNNDGYEISVHDGMNPKWSFNAYKYFEELGDRVYMDFDCINISGEITSDEDGSNKFIWPIETSKLFWKRQIGNDVITFLSPHLVYKFKKLEQQKKNVIRDKELMDFKELEKLIGDFQ